jgi:hypothetical protein
MFGEHKFKTFGKAKIFANVMKKNYGYTPSVFRVKTPKRKISFVVIRPRNLKRIY